MDGGVGAVTPEVIDADLATRLRVRRNEIEQALFVGVCELSDPVATDDADYVAGLRAALSAGFDASLVRLENPEADTTRLLGPLAAQARRAARRGFSLDAVLRRCAAAQLLLGEFIMDEADRVSPGAGRDALRLLRAQFDRTMALMADEFRREADRVEDCADERRAQLVERLLAGAPVDTSQLDYELESWHLGMIVAGPTAWRAVRELQMALGCQSLCVWRDRDRAWLWFGARRPRDSMEIERACQARGLRQVSVSLGEPGEGVDGWRLTHQQARTAQWVATRRPGQLTRYADELLLAAALKDDVLAQSLRAMYLAPLNGSGNGGARARVTLRAYFGAGCNAASAAAALGVDRHTVERRLRRIEDKLGRWIQSCHAELELALRMEELDGVSDDEPVSAAQ